MQNYAITSINANMRLYIMSSKQGPPSEKAKALKDLSQHLFHEYSRRIVHYEQPISVCASYVEKEKIIMNTDCILVMYKTEVRTFIGYAKMIYPKDPLVRRVEDIEKRISLENVINAYILDDCKLSIKHNIPLDGEVKELVVKFLHKNLMYEWLSLIINEQNAFKKILQRKEIEPYRAKINELEQDRSKMQAEIEDFKRTQAQWEAKSQSFDILQKDLQSRLEFLESENKANSNKIKELESQRTSLLKDIQDAYSSKQEKEDQCKKLAQNLRKGDQALQKYLTDAQSSPREQTKKSQAELQVIQSRILEKQQNNIRQGQIFQQKLAESERIINSYRKQNESLRKQLKQMKIRLQQQIRSKDSLQDTVNKLKISVTEQEKNIDYLNAKIENQNIEIQQFQHRQTVVQAQLKQKSSQLTRKEQQSAFLRLQGLFVGNVLNDYPHHKLFLKDTLESQRNMQILKTRLLFQLDPLNKVNFHSYIDNQPDLLVVVKTAEGAFLAGYTECAISPSNNADRVGVIMSLTNQLVFQLQEERKSVTYDDYYIIFGNSEIRLKSLELSVFSNFGIANGFYNNRGMGVEALLCSPNREVEIESYEVHRVYFGE